MAPRSGILNYEDDILGVADSLGIDGITALRLGQAESGGNPFATSSAGAGGLYQLMPPTARSLGVSDITNTKQNISGGLNYFDQMQDKYGSGPLAVAAYNYGPTALDALIDKAGTSDIGALYPLLPPETQGHIAKVMRPVAGENPIADMSVGKISRPLPPLPNIYSGVRPLSPVPTDIAGATSRDSDLERLQAENRGLEQMRTQTLEGLRNANNLSDEDALAVALTAIVPTLLGFAFGGSRGGAVGAEAGAQGAGVGITGMRQDLARKQQVDSAMLQNLNQRILGNQQEAKETRQGIFREKQQEERDMRLAEYNADRDDRRAEMQAERDQRLFGKGGLKDRSEIDAARLENERIRLAMLNNKLKEQDPTVPEEIVSILTTPVSERTPEQKAKILQNSKWTNLDATQRRIVASETSADAFAQSVDQAGEKQKFEEGKQLRFGAIKAPGAPVLSASTITRLDKEDAATEKLLTNLDMQLKNVKKNKRFDYFGDDAWALNALKSESFNIDRMRTNSGAALTDMEVSLLKALRPATASSDGMWAAFSQWARDVDPEVALKTVKDLMLKEKADTYLTYGRFLPGQQYSKSQLDRFGVGPNLYSELKIGSVIDDDGDIIFDSRIQNSNENTNRQGFLMQNKGKPVKDLFLEWKRSQGGQ